jgi:Protein of unknown function (DUF2911)
MRWLIMFIVLLGGATHEIFAADNPAKPKTATSTCTFQDGKQMSVRYEAGGVGKKGLPQGELWPPSGSPMLLFTQVALSVANSDIPAAAYSAYLIPEKDKWTLVINKAVSAGSPYDQQQDLVRVPMQIGHLGRPMKNVKVVFGHVAPKQCNMRIYSGKIGAWAEFNEK